MDFKIASITPAEVPTLLPIRELQRLEGLEHEVKATVAAKNRSDAISVHPTESAVRP